MARSKTSLQINAEYAAALALAAGLRTLPRPAATRVGHALLRLLFRLMRKRRRIVRANLKDAFPTHSEADHARIADDSLFNLARGAVGFLHTRSYVHKAPDSWVAIEGIEHLDAALANGRGVIAFTGHYGCWELMSTAMMLEKPDRVAVVYRAMDNPKIDRWVANHRTIPPGRLIERRSLLREGLRWLKDNKIVGILMDQNFAAGGTFVPFLGRIAATTPIVSILARRTGSVVLPVHNRWDGDRLQVIWEPPLTLSQNPDPHEAVRQDTMRMNDVISGWIRQDPGQWFWLHNRWKKQPVSSV